MSEPTSDSTALEDAREATERWFLRRGLPHFIHPYRATEDVFTRMLPVLAVIFVVEMVVVAADRDWSLWINAVVVVVVLALLAAGYAAQNVLRERPAFRRPDSVGAVELAVFVLGPTIPALVKADWSSALRTGVANLLLLGAIYLVTSYGVVPTSRWALTHGVDQLRSAVTVLLRALPVLLLIVIVVFLAAEAWQVSAELEWPAMILVVTTFALIAIAFAAIRVPTEIARFSHESWSEIRDRVQGTPARSLLEHVPDAGRPPVPLSRRARLNVGLVVLVSEGILVVIVSCVMFVFLLGFGAAAIHQDVVTAWLGQPPDVLVEFHFFSQTMVITGELLKVSAFLTGFCALSFTVSLLTDAGYQEDFLTELEDELAEAFAVRAVYRSADLSPG